MRDEWTGVLHCFCCGAGEACPAKGQLFLEALVKHKTRREQDRFAWVQKLNFALAPCNRSVVALSLTSELKYNIVWNLENA